MDISYTVHSSQGDEYCVIISSFTSNLPTDISVFFKRQGIDIADITLERKSGSNIADYKILSAISNTIAEIFNGNENLILYFYCDDMKEIRRRNLNISPQEYRSKLFSKLIDRYLLTNGITDIINTPINIKADREIFIHIISRTAHNECVQMIKQQILDIGNK